MSGHTRAIRLAVLASVVALPVVAQTTPSPSDTTSRSFHFRAGGGVNLADALPDRSGLRAQTSRSSNFVLGFDWQRPSSRLALRLDGIYSSRRVDYPFPLMTGIVAGATCDEAYCVTGTQTKMAGATLDARYDLTKTRLSPYVMSGIGLYRVTRTNFANVRCDDQFACVRAPNEYNPVRWGASGMLGLHTGLGFSYRVQGAQLFTEVRLQTLTNSAYQPSKFPVTFGFRF
jgi:opacity protein-like surface antigen